MKATFELDDGIEEKHFFPHYFNKTSNYGVELPHLPDKKYYGLTHIIFANFINAFNLDIF